MYFKDIYIYIYILLLLLFTLEKKYLGFNYIPYMNVTTYRLRANPRPRARNKERPQNR